MKAKTESDMHCDKIHKIHTRFKKIIRPRKPLCHGKGVGGNDELVPASCCQAIITIQLSSSLSAAAVSLPVAGQMLQPVV